MAKSRTSRAPSAPILGGLFGVKGPYVTKISGGGKTRTGAGRTPQESQKNASKKWGKR